MPCRGPSRLLSLLLVLAACRGDSREPSPTPPPPTAAPSPPPAPAPPAGPTYCRRAGASAITPAPLSGATGSALRPANTFSIVARDPITGDIGVAVQSHWFSVGALVTWAEPGVGAVATQSFVEPAYGPRGLALLRSGATPTDALSKLVAADAASSVRQVAFVDAKGRAAAHTGAKCIAHASHHVGDGYSVQANMMASDRVVPAMRDAFEATKGDLAERMLAALDAAQAAGGDIRGCQSAAILVVGGQRTDTPWISKKLDLRVEDSPTPLAELRRLVTLARAYDHMNQGDLAVEKQDMAGALEHYGTAAKLVPGNAEMAYWQAVALASHGRTTDATPLFRRAFADDPAWIELTRRLPAAGLLDAAVADQVVRDTGQ